MQNTVVIDGELSLLFEDIADCFLVIPESGEAGVYMAIGGNNLPPYTGDVIVTPQAESPVVLETANKSLYEDITVLEIPYVETSNLSGGYTVSIG